MARALCFARFLEIRSMFEEKENLCAECESPMEPGFILNRADLNYPIELREPQR